MVLDLAAQIVHQIMFHLVINLVKYLIAHPIGLNVVLQALT